MKHLAPKRISQKLKSLAQFEKSLKVVKFFLWIPLQTVEKEKGFKIFSKKKKTKQNKNEREKDIQKKEGKK
jgi:hypothetical protein